VPTRVNQNATALLSIALKLASGQCPSNQGDFRPVLLWPKQTRLNTSPPSGLGFTMTVTSKSPRANSSPIQSPPESSSSVLRWGGKTKSPWLLVNLNVEGHGIMTPPTTLLLGPSSKTISASKIWCAAMHCSTASCVGNGWPTQSASPLPCRLDWFAPCQQKPPIAFRVFCWFLPVPPFSESDFFRSSILPLRSL
jgi:hypothetical protein